MFGFPHGSPQHLGCAVSCTMWWRLDFWVLFGWHWCWLFNFGFVALVEQLNFEIPFVDILNCGQIIGAIGNSTVLLNWIVLFYFSIGSYLFILPMAEFQTTLLIEILWINYRVHSKHLLFCFFVVCKFFGPNFNPWFGICSVDHKRNDFIIRVWSKISVKSYMTQILMLIYFAYCGSDRLHLILIILSTFGDCSFGKVEPGHHNALFLVSWLNLVMNMSWRSFLLGGKGNLGRR